MPQPHTPQEHTISACEPVVSLLGYSCALQAPGNAGCCQFKHEGVGCDARVCGRTNCKPAIQAKDTGTAGHERQGRARAAASSCAHAIITYRAYSRYTILRSCWVQHGRKRPLDLNTKKIRWVPHEMISDINTPANLGTDIALCTVRSVNNY